jgi:hypothetical protein
MRFAFIPIISSFRSSVPEVSEYRKTFHDPWLSSKQRDLYLCSLWIRPTWQDKTHLYHRYCTYCYHIEVVWLMKTGFWIEHWTYLTHRLQYVITIYSPVVSPIQNYNLYSASPVLHFEYYIAHDWLLTSFSSDGELAQLWNILIITNR